MHCSVDCSHVLCRLSAYLLLTLYYVVVMSVMHALIKFSVFIKQVCKKLFVD